MHIDSVTQYIHEIIGAASLGSRENCAVKYISTIVSITYRDA